ncbi:FAD-binding oxidoreductase [Nitrospira defluvii]|nr:FAD-binding oxidoreductase [Nitrospira defluvii]
MPENFSRLRDRLGSKKVLTDNPAITAYAIDASIYKVNPQAIVLIESGQDLAVTLDFARTHRIPITARSGGTNLTGNALGEGIILEFSRLNRLIEVNTHEGWARVEPGIVYAQLNRQLAETGWMFAPDPSSGDMCKLGGMIGTNAAGPHTLKYGATKENILEIEILLSNGNWITAKDYRLNDSALGALFEENPSIRAIYDLINENKALIQSKRRKVSKNSSGYNLFDLADRLEQGIFSLHKLFIGSEGTLGLTRTAKIRLVQKPLETATALIYLKSLSDIGRVVNTLLELSPSALEMMDSNTLDLVGRERFGIPEDAAVMLLLEFDDSIHKKMERAKSRITQAQLCGPIKIEFDPVQQASLWKARKAMYPTLYKFDSQKKPINFVDDVVVAADRIPELIRYLEDLFSERGIAVAIYGHIGNGNAHINPLLNINDPTDFKNMVALSREIHQTVIERFDGSLCGEHGDGRVRAEFLKDLYGPELYNLFKQVKSIMDPEGILNPGVKITEIPFTENIDFERLSKQCATCGKCNSVCPVYDVVGEESNAARGWFHILTAQDYNYEQSSRVVEACINCKSCRTVCPAGIDVSELILKAREEHPNKVAGVLFRLQDHLSIFEPLLKLAAWTQPIWDSPIGRRLIEKATQPWLKGLAPTARIPADMVFPRLAKQHLRDRYSALCNSKSQVAYFHGCAANYFDDGVGDAVIQLLEQNGVEVTLPPQRCSGTPIQTYGWKDLVRKNAKFNIDSLDRFDKVITGCASCTFMLKDYRSLFEENGSDDIKRDWRSKAEGLASKVVHISEFMLNEKGWKGEEEKGWHKNPAHKTKRVTYHSSCHLRAAGVSDEPRELLRRHPELSFIEMPDADLCAGGSGTFLVKNPEQSAKIFERKRRGIEASGADVVATSCPACMIQLNNGLKGKVEVKHIAELLLSRNSLKQK